MRVMSASLLARAVVSAIAAGQGIVPLFIDLNRSHATNPLWPGHARFHVVWQTFTLLFAAGVQVALLWWPGPLQIQRFYLAALLTALPLTGFLVALFARGLYNGTLHDPNGIRPVRIEIAERIVEIDMNVVIVLFASALLAAAVVLA